MKLFEEFIDSASRDDLLVKDNRWDDTQDEILSPEEWNAINAKRFTHLLAVNVVMDFDRFTAIKHIIDQIERILRARFFDEFSIQKVYIYKSLFTKKYLEAGFQLDSTRGTFGYTRKLSYSGAGTIKIAVSLRTIKTAILLIGALQKAAGLCSEICIFPSDGKKFKSPNEEQGWNSVPAIDNILTGRNYVDFHQRVLISEWFFGVGIGASVQDNLENINVMLDNILTR